MDDSYRIIKYPRTPHLEGSRIQPGDEDLDRIPFSSMAGRHLVIEEKIDGANVAISFDRDGTLKLQSRGHFLTGGYRERHYDLFKQWATVHAGALRRVLGCRYVMYGEWMYAKHSVYYDALPHYFMEFDILNRETGRFLDTPSRRALTASLPICSVPVLAEGIFSSQAEMMPLLGPSRFITERHHERLRETALREHLDPDRIARETDDSPTMEGLYIKVEEHGEVVDRVKFVRQSFTQTVETSQTNWLDRPIVPNGLNRPIEELFL